MIIFLIDTIGIVLATAGVVGSRATRRPAWVAASAAGMMLDAVAATAGRDWPLTVLDLALAIAGLAFLAARTLPRR